MEINYIDNFETWYENKMLTSPALNQIDIISRKIVNDRTATLYYHWAYSNYDIFLGVSADGDLALDILTRDGLNVIFWGAYLGGNVLEYERMLRDTFTAINLNESTHN